MPSCATADFADLAGQVYRDATIQPLCGVCHVTTTDTLCCPRCQTPLCQTHATDSATRCPGCEATFDSLLADRRRHPVQAWLLPLLYVAGATGAAVTVPRVSRVLGVFAAVLVALAAAALPLFFAWYRRARLRPRFLRETPARRRLRIVQVALPAAPRVAKPTCGWSVASLATSALAIMPGLPVLAITLACVGLQRRRTHDTSYATAGLTVGIVMLCIQTAVALSLVL